MSDKELIQALKETELDTLKDKEALLDEAMELINRNSYPGLAVDQGTLLNRIYKLSSTAISKAKELK